MHPPLPLIHRLSKALHSPKPSIPQRSVVATPIQAPDPLRYRLFRRLIPQFILAPSEYQKPKPSPLPPALIRVPFHTALIDHHFHPHRISPKTTQIPTSTHAETSTAIHVTFTPELQGFFKLIALLSECFCYLPSPKCQSAKVPFAPKGACQYLSKPQRAQKSKTRIPSLFMGIMPGGELQLEKGQSRSRQTCQIANLKHIVPKLTPQEKERNARERDRNST